jgi:hypothetical protein
MARASYMLPAIIIKLCLQYLSFLYYSYIYTYIQFYLSNSDKKSDSCKFGLHTVCIYIIAVDNEYYYVKKQ